MIVYLKEDLFRTEMMAAFSKTVHFEGKPRPNSQQNLKDTTQNMSIQHLEFLVQDLNVL